MKTALSVPDVWLRQLAPYRAWLKASGRPDSTIYKRLYHVRKFAVTSGIAPFEVTLQQLLDYLGNDGWGDAMRRSNRASLQKFYRWAHVTGRMNYDPSALLPPIAVAPGRRRMPATDEALHAGMTATDQRVRLMVELGDRAGLRCCEIARVHYADLHGPCGGRMLLVHGKGGKERLVPISEGLYSVILERSLGGWLFPGQIDGHISFGHVSKLISRAMKGLGTAHTLRHRAGTRWMDTSGGNLRVVQEALGHASPVTTQIYTHVPASDLRSAVLAA